VIPTGSEQDDKALRANQQLYNGFGNGFARAFELAVTPAIFGFLGYLLDRAVGTSPVFLIVFALLCVIGMGIRMYYGYDQAMRREEAESTWGRPAKPKGVAP
jgi:F0F1-type ATP synthase assembly protein I